MDENKAQEVEVTPEELAQLQGTEEVEITPEEAELLGVGPSAEALPGNIEDAIKEIQRRASEERGPLTAAYDVLMESPGVSTFLATAAKKGPLAGLKAGAEAAFEVPELYPTFTEAAAALGVPKKEVDIAPIVAGLVPGGPIAKAGIEALTGKPARIPLEAQAGVGAALGAVADPSILIPGKTQARAIGLAAAPLVVGAKEAGMAALKGAGRLGLEAVQESADIARASIKPLSLAQKHEDIIRSTQGTLKAVKTAAEEATNSLKSALNPPLQESVKLDLDTAQAINLPAPLINASTLFGPDSLISAVQKAQAQNRIGPELQNHAEGIRQVSNAVSAKLAKMAGKSDIGADRQAIGQAMKAAYDDGIRAFFNARPVRYSTVTNYLPDTDIPADLAEELITKLKFTADDLRSKIEAGIPLAGKTRSATLENIEKIISQLENPSRIPPSVARQFADGIRAQFEQFKQAGAVVPEYLQKRLSQYEQMAQRLEGIAGKQNLENLIFQLQDLGKALFAQEKYLGKEVSPDYEQLRKTYNEIAETVLKVVERKGSPELAQELARVNAETEFFLKQNKILAQKILPDSAPVAELVDHIFSQNNPERLKAFLTIAGPAGFEPAQAGAALKIDDILRTKTDDLPVDAKTLDDFIKAKIYIFPSSKKALFNNADLLSNMIQSGIVNEKDAMDLIKILNLGESYGYPILNPSGTFVSAQVNNLTDAIMPLGGKFSAAGKNFAAAIANRVAGTRIVDQAQIKAIQKALSGSREEILQRYSENAAGMLAKLYREKSGEPGRIFLSDVLADIKMKQMEEAKMAQKSLRSYGKLELAAKSYIVLKRIHDSGDRIPVEVPDEFKEDIAKQILSDPELSNIQKGRNLISLKNTGFLLDISKSPTPKAKKKAELPEERKEKLKQAAIGTLKWERKQDVFKPEKEEE